MSILNFPEVIVYDVNIIANEGGTLQDVANYLYEYHGFGFDIDLYYNELNEAEAPKASTGGKVKDHFKKHWKKYAAGAGAAAAVGGAAYLGHKKGKKSGNAEGYKTGHEHGQINGFSTGHNVGFERGMEKGHRDGHIDGFNLGQKQFKSKLK